MRPGGQRSRTSDKVDLDCGTGVAKGLDITKIAAAMDTMVMAE
jgi:hypothetical protein